MSDSKGSGPHRHRSKQRLQRHLDQTTDGVYVVDTDWRVQFWNESMVERTGITREDALGTDLWELSIEMMPATLEARYREAMETGGARFEFRRV